MSLRVTPRYEPDFPLASIIILNFNNSNLTIECLNSIWANTLGVRYEIIVVDNGSAAVELQKLRDIEHAIRLISLPENKYFGQGCNIGALHAKGEYLVFLNNDILVLPNWLEPLIRLLQEYPNAGTVGPRMIYPDGRLQEAGAFIDEIGNPIQIGTYGLYHAGEHSETRVVDYCSAACLALRARTFAELGGFDALFTPAYYEDVDLCFKIASTGKFTYYCPDSTVIHIQNATASKVWKRSELDMLMETNRRKFLARWGDWLRARANGLEAEKPGVVGRYCPPDVREF